MRILDKGSLEVMETWGSDERIVEVARTSTQKGFLGWGGPRCNKCGYDGGPWGSTGDVCLMCTDNKSKLRAYGDERLLRYLHEHKHSTPFEFAGLTIRVKAPIAVFREWHRHRTQSYSEMSARYIPMPDEAYVPSVSRLLMTSAHNKQAGSARGADELDANGAEDWLSLLSKLYDHSQEVYAQGLAMGVPKEVARLAVPVGRYSIMCATANLRNWLGFMALRSTLKGPDAQWEIRQYADAVGAIIADAFPRTWELFSEG